MKTNRESALVWARALNIPIQSVDEAVLFQRFFDVWAKNYAIPLEEDDAGGILEWSHATRAAWRVVRALNININNPRRIR